MNDQKRPDRNLAIELVRVTEAAALAAGPWNVRECVDAGVKAVEGVLVTPETSIDGPLLGALGALPNELEMEM